MPKVLSLYSRDFKKNEVKMLKALSNYLSTEQKKNMLTALESSNLTVKYEETNSKFHYSFLHFNSLKMDNEEFDDEPEEEEQIS